MSRQWGGTRLRESIKTGLAMVIAVGISFRMAFEEPAWTMFTVGMISLDTAGQSLNKAGLRMTGTLLAGLVSLTLVALFPQDRWAMILALGVWVGFCTYMMAGPRRQYFWFVSAFVVMTVMIHGGVESASAFRFAVARVEETALGILVYSLVSVFLWPHDSGDDLEAASRAAFQAQHRVFRAYRELLAGQGRPEDSRPLRLEEIQGLSQLDGLLAAAETDTYRVQELRGAWREFVRRSNELMDALARWRISLPEVRELDLARVLPGAVDFLDELEQRFVRIEQGLAGEEVGDAPRPADLAVDEQALSGLSHFDKAAVALLVQQLRKLDAVSRGLWDCVAEIRGSGRIGLSPPATPGWVLPPFDVDRFRAALTVVATLWIGFSLWVWLDPPGHAMFWFSSAQWVLISVLTGQRIAVLVPGFLVGIAVSTVAYVGVMPHLSGYSELGLLIFAVTAGGFYVFWEPRRRGIRTILIAVFASLCTMDNHQTYSFAGFASGVAMTLLSVGLAFATTYVGSSPRPEKVFVRLLSRFFRRAERLVSRLAPDRFDRAGPIDRWLAAVDHRELLAIPRKLEALVDRIDYRLLPGSRPEAVHALVTNLLDVALRVEELRDARMQLRAAPWLEGVVEELRAWRVRGQEQFDAWAADPGAGLVAGADAAQLLSRRLARVEAALEAARAGDDGQPLRVDYGPLYRYLGAFRGLSEAGVAYAGRATAVDWTPWQEARF